MATQSELMRAKFRCTLRGGQVVEVFAGSEAEARREVRWIAPRLETAIVAIERDDLWGLRDAASRITQGAA